MTLALPAPSRSRATSIIDAFANVNVLVVGDLMLDRYLLGDVDRISAEAPVPIVNVLEESDVAGGAANVAANVVALGARCRLVGVIGDDTAGETLAGIVAAQEINSAGVVRIPGRVTTSKARILARGHQIVRIDREVTTPLPAQAREAVIASALDGMTHCDVVVLEDYDKGVFDHEMIRTIIAAAQKAKKAIVVDPKVKHFFSFGGATVFKPNRREIELAFTNRPGGANIDFAAARVELGVEHLLVTLGADGMDLVSAGGVARAPGMPREVFDVSGAGDTVTAWVAAALAAGAKVEEAAWLANVAASVTVGKRGTATVSSAEVMALLM